MSAQPARQAIVEAAIAEFSAHGLDGVRLEHVARRAGCNKSLIYRYFTNKQGLFEAVLEHALNRRLDVLNQQPLTLGPALVHWFCANAEDPDFLRLIQREALNDDGGQLVCQDQRCAYYARQIKQLEALQAQGIAPEIPADLLFLSLLALTVYPYLIPTICRLVTGETTNSEAFQSRWSTLLEGLAKRLCVDLQKENAPGQDFLKGRS